MAPRIFLPKLVAGVLDRVDMSLDYGVAVVIEHAHAGDEAGYTVRSGLALARERGALRHRPAVPDRLGTFFLRAFAREVGARFEHAEEMRHGDVGKSPRKRFLRELPRDLVGALVLVRSGGLLDLWL